jgi:heme-degrading monooxygenase HmoA
MEIYVATVLAKKGHEDDVARFYQDQEDELRSAKGFRGRQILRARTGAMRAAVSKVIPAEEMAKHPAEEPPGTHFIIIEQWDSSDDKTAYSRAADAGRAKDLIPHLLPEHTHEYYEDISSA